jgi:hypothetical protein
LIGLGSLFLKTPMFTPKKGTVNNPEDAFENTAY